MVADRDDQEQGVERVRFFYANCQIGRFNYRLGGTRYALPHLLRDSEECGIGRRLGYHATAKEQGTATAARP